jgi:hypothetical protein
LCGDDGGIVTIGSNTTTSSTGLRSSRHHAETA